MQGQSHDGPGAPPGNIDPSDGRADESDGGTEPPAGPGRDASPAPSADAEGSCSRDDECPAGKQYCSDMRCVACTMDTHCPAGKKCAPDRTCVECLVSSDCVALAHGRPFCTAGNVCVECAAHGDCKTAERPLCAAGACVRCDAGGDSSGCAAKNSALPICVASSGLCAQCGVSTDCKVEANPICAQNRCVPCTRDAECKARDGDRPGICLHPREGRCAGDDETIYVRNANPCSMVSGEGRIEMPFCQPQRAINALTNTRRIIRMRGPELLSNLDISGTGAPITIIGQEGATITSPASIGIQIRSGNVQIRGLGSVGNQTGIVVATGSTVQLNRVLVEINREGGLLVSNGVTFDISNSVFAKNGLGSVGPTRYGGVFLGTPGAGRTGRFRASTVVDNNEVGVVCNSASQSLVGVLLFNNVGANSFFCMTPTGREGMDPRFLPARPYHLTEGAPCQEAMAASEMPVDDFDGEPRPFPSNGRSDCGADELHPTP